MRLPYLGWKSKEGKVFRSPRGAHVALGRKGPGITLSLTPGLLTGCSLLGTELRAAVEAPRAATHPPLIGHGHLRAGLGVGEETSLFGLKQTRAVRLFWCRGAIKSTGYTPFSFNFRNTNLKQFFY